MTFHGLAERSLCLCNLPDVNTACLAARLSYPYSARTESRQHAR